MISGNDSLQNENCYQKLISIFDYNVKNNGIWERIDVKNTLWVVGSGLQKINFLTSKIFRTNPAKSSPRNSGLLALQAYP